MLILSYPTNNVPSTLELPLAHSKFILPQQANPKSTICAEVGGTQENSLLLLRYCHNEHPSLRPLLILCCWWCWWRRRLALTVFINLGKDIKTSLRNNVISQTTFHTYEFTYLHSNSSIIEHRTLFPLSPLTWRITDYLHLTYWDIKSSLFIAFFLYNNSIQLKDISHPFFPQHPEPFPSAGNPPHEYMYE